jgi:hypothetical protein
MSLLSPISDNQSFLEAALNYARLGWRVFPVHGINALGGCSCGKSSCENPGKHPKTQHGIKDATNDARIIRTWAEKHPDANVGIATGYDFIVVDADTRNDGLTSLAQLALEIGGFPDTITALSGSEPRGMHLYLFAPPGVEIKCKSGFRLGVDIKGTGGYIIAPPSRHKSGNFYQWFNGRSPNEITIAEIPHALLALLISNKNKTPSVEIDCNQKLLDGERNSSLASFAGSMRRRGMSETAISAALKIENREKCNPPLDDDEVERIAKSVSKYEPSIQIQSPTERPFPIISPDAFYGIAGDFVRTVEPYSEADPVAILINFLVFFGNCIGSNAHFLVEHSKHFLRLFIVLVGNSSVGRKGTSLSTIQHIYNSLDQDWLHDCVTGGASSGEGLIFQVRDEVTRERLNKDTGQMEEEVIDYGVDDKRLLLIEEEFAQLLKLMSREGNILSAIIRQAWDHGNLRTLVKNNPTKATGAHISIMAHIVKDELLKYFHETEQANGFGNRFLWFSVKRSKLIPNPKGVDLNSLSSLSSQLSESLAYGKNAFLITKNAEAQALWDILYPELSKEVSGIVGAMVARAAPQVMRIASIFALLDKTTVINPNHLKAAKAIVDYSERSVRFVFGDSIGDHIADRIHQELSLVFPDGLTETELHCSLGNHAGKRFRGALITLQQNQLAYSTVERTRGRPVTRWYAKKAK